MTTELKRFEVQACWDVLQVSRLDVEAETPEQAWRIAEHEIQDGNWDFSNNEVVWDVCSDNRYSVWGLDPDQGGLPKETGTLGELHRWNEQLTIPPDPEPPPAILGKLLAAVQDRVADEDNDGNGYCDGCGDPLETWDAEGNHESEKEFCDNADCWRVELRALIAEAKGLGVKDPAPSIANLTDQLDIACEALKIVAEGGAAGRWLDASGCECAEDEEGARWQEYNQGEQAAWVESCAKTAQTALDQIKFRAWGDKNGIPITPGVDLNATIEKGTMTVIES